MKAPVPLISYARARWLLLAWAESIGETLDVCPLPAPDNWVYFSAAEGHPIKVGFTGQPNIRPFTCWRDYGLPSDTYPLVMISGAGRSVERLVKRAGYPWSLSRLSWNSRHAREAFFPDSPVASLVRLLRADAEANFFHSEWLGVHEGIINREIAFRRRKAA